METVVRIKFGSHLYGTNTPLSDEDFKGVYIPDFKDILLQRVKGSVNNKRSKNEGEKNLVGEVDEEFYSLQKYLSLLAEGQTVAIDMLFATSSCILETSNLWKFIYENRHRFLSKKSTSFVGYCKAQSAKYGTKGSRVAAAKSAMELFKFEYERRGATHKLFHIAEQMQALEGEHIKLIELPISNDENNLAWYFECCNRKICFTNTIKQAYEVFSKIYENYGSRARLAESNEGIDWKAMSHAARVGHEALEFLNTGHVTFPLSNAKHVLRIKQGLLPYSVVAEEIENLLIRVGEASEKSQLPEEPDREFIDDMVVRVYGKSVNYGLYNEDSNLFASQH